MRSKAKIIWKYIGCSHHSVPSLSNVAIRSCGGTKSGPPSFVTFSTNATIACLAGRRSRRAAGIGREMLVARR